MTNPVASILIPALNEEASIEKVVVSLQELYPQFELIVIDDGSTDQTGLKAKTKGARVLRHPKNQGYGAALKTGIRHMTGDIAVFFDGDGQHDPKDISRLLEKMEGADMVVGARSPQNDPLVRRFGKKILSFFVNRALGQKIPDFNSGLRALRRGKVLPLLPLLPDGFSLTTTVTLLFFKKNYPVIYIPIVTYPTTSPSKVRARDFFKTLFLILKNM